MRTIRVGQNKARDGRSMSTVKNALAQKSGALIHVRSGDMVVEALSRMRDHRVRSVLVIDDGVLVGIVTQGDCAIKVLLPGLDAKHTPVGQVMTVRPVTVTPDDEGPVILTEEQKRRRNARSVAIALALGALVIIFFLVTIVRLGGNVFNRPI